MTAEEFYDTWRCYLDTHEKRIEFAEAYAKHTIESYSTDNNCPQCGTKNPLIEALQKQVEEYSGLIEKGIEFNNDQVWVDKAEQALKPH